MEKTTSYEGWIDHDVYDSDGDKIGSIDAIYYDDITGRPEWLAVRTGLFGMNTSFVPISGATVYNDDLQVPYTKDTVKKAPNTDPHTLDTGALGLGSRDEQRLFDHYGFAYDDRSYGTYPRIDTDFKVRSMERSDFAETVPSGKTRLRRYVVTETRR
jgi:PRC-barrel domain